MKIRTELIEWYIKSTRMSKKEFCERCDITTDIYKRIMKNNYKYHTSSIIRVAEEMGIEVCDLYTKE